MIRGVLIQILLALPSVLLAGRTPGFSVSAVSSVVPPSAGDVVFSPVSFEFDCAMISEAFGPLEKAVYVESLGALVGYDSVFKPIAERYAAARTNGFALVSARAFLASSLRMIAPEYRSFIHDEYGAGACPVQPTADGAESFLRASMDGSMEDFRVPEGLSRKRGVSFVDLESFSCLWADPFPSAATRRAAFTTADGRKAEVEMMSDVREGVLRKDDRYSALRLPMADGAFLVLVLPDPGVPLASVRGVFAAEKFDELLLSFRSVVDPGLYQGRVSVGIPRLSLDVTVDLKPAFLELKLPIGGFKSLYLDADSTLLEMRQRTRFVLDERSVPGCGARGVEAGVASRSFVCDRPFLFFVYHEPTRTVPVAGAYVGG